MPQKEHLKEVIAEELEILLANKTHKPFMCLCVLLASNNKPYFTAVTT